MSNSQFIVEFPFLPSDFHTDGPSHLCGEAEKLVTVKPKRDECALKQLRSALHLNALCFTICQLLTCLSCVIVSLVVAVATMAPLLPGLSCRDRESPETKCTPSCVTLTLSSTTLMLLSARTDDVTGDSTCNGAGKLIQTAVGDIDDHHALHLLKHTHTHEPRSHLYGSSAHSPSLQHRPILHSGYIRICHFQRGPNKFGHIHLSIKRGEKKHNTQSC